MTALADIALVDRLRARVDRLVDENERLLAENDGLRIRLRSAEEGLLVARAKGGNATRKSDSLLAHLTIQRIENQRLRRLVAKHDRRFTQAGS